MAIDNGDIVLDLRLDDKDFAVTVRNSGKLLRELRGDLDRAATGAENVEKHFGSFSAGFRHTVMSLAAVRFALMDFYDIFLRLPASILQTSGEMERLTMLMKGLSKATTDIARTQEAIQNKSFILDLAKNAPFEISAISNALVKLKSGGIDPTNGSLQALIDSVARFGGDSQALARSSVAIQQMAGKGVISMEELRQQLGEAVPDAMKMMAEGMGISIGELTKKVSLGAVESGDALRRMFTMMEFHNRGAAKDMMETWTGLTSRMKTEWTILQTQIGESGFSDAVKTQLKGLIDAMGSPEGVAMAKQLGTALGELVMSARGLLNALRENWEMIKLVGEILLIAFAGSKIKNALTVFNKALQDQKKLFKETVDTARLKRQQAVADLQIEAQAATQKAARDKAELESSKAKYAQLKTEHLKHLAEIRALNKSSDSLSNISGSPMAATLITQNKERIKQLREQDREIKKLIQAEKGLQSSVAAGLVVSQQAATAKEAIAKSAADAAAKMGIMATAGAGLRAVLGALGGPIGVITAALSIGIPMWMQWGNAGEKAIQKIRDALNSNTSTEETIDLINNQIRQKQKELNEFNNSTRFSLFPKTRNDLQEEEAERKRLQDEIAELEKNLVTAKEQHSQNAADASIAAQKRAFEREIAEIASQYRNKAAMIHDSAKEQLEGIKKGSEEEIRIEKEKNLAIQKNAQDLANAQIDILEKHRQKAKAILDDAKKSGNETRIKGAEKHLNALTEDAIARDLERFRDNAMHLSDPLNFKQEKIKKPDPLQQALEKSKADLEAAKIKMDDLLDGAITFDRLKEAAFAKLMGQREAGTFNVKDDRGNSVKPSADRSEFQETASNIAETDQIERETRVQRALTSLVAQSAQERQNALERFSGGGFYDQESTGVRRLEKQIAKLKEELVNDKSERAQKALENIKNTADKIVSDQAVADLLNFTAGFKKAREEISVGLQDTELGQKKAAFALEMNLLKSQLKQREDEITKNSKLTSEQMQKDIENATIQSGLLQARMWEKFHKDMRTPLQQLSSQWEDVTARMRQASTRWSEQTMDQIINMVKTGKFEWRDLADTILTDIARISLQKGIGGALNSIFDKGVNAIAGGLFGADTSSELPIDPATGAVRTVDATKTGQVAETIKQSEIFKTANERLSSMWDGVKVGMNNVWEGMKGMLGTLGDGLGNFVSGLGSAMSNFLSSLAGGGTSLIGDIIGTIGSIAGSFAGSMGGGGGGIGGTGSGSFTTASNTGYGGLGGIRSFANGGIMTQFGEVSLRKYAKGGIANFPQLALHGEGSMPEAYVPLPDGRSIPVTFSGSMGSGTNIYMNITVNGDGSSSVDTKGASDESTWRKIASRVTGVVREELVVQKRPGGILAK